MMRCRRLAPSTFFSALLVTFLHSHGLVAQDQPSPLDYAEKAGNVCAKIATLKKDGSSTFTLDGVQYKFEGGAFEAYIGADLVRSGRYSAKDNNECMKIWRDFFLELEKLRNPPQPRQSEYWIRTFASSGQIWRAQLYAMQNGTSLLYACSRPADKDFKDSQPTLFRLDRFGDTTQEQLGGSCEIGSFERYSGDSRRFDVSLPIVENWSDLGIQVLGLSSSGGDWLDYARFPALPDGEKLFSLSYINDDENGRYIVTPMFVGTTMLDDSDLSNKILIYDKDKSEDLSMRLNQKAIVPDAKMLRVKFVQYRGRDQQNYYFIGYGDFVVLLRKYGVVLKLVYDSWGSKWTFGYKSIIDAESTNPNNLYREFQVGGVAFDGAASYILANEVLNQYPDVYSRTVLLKVNVDDGSEIWRKEIDNEGTSFFTSVTVDHKSGQVWLGGANHLKPVTSNRKEIWLPNESQADSRLLAIDSTGAILLDKTFGLSGPDSIEAVEALEDGQVMILGRVLEDNGAGDTQLYVIKAKPNANDTFDIARAVETAF